MDLAQTVNDHTVVIALIGIIGSGSAAAVWAFKILVKNLVDAVSEFKRFRVIQEGANRDLNNHDAAIMTALDTLLRNDEQNLMHQERQTKILEQLAVAINNMANGIVKV